MFKIKFFAYIMLSLIIVSVFSIKTNSDEAFEINNICQGLLNHRASLYSGMGSIVYEYISNGESSIENNNPLFQSLDKASKLKRLQHYKYKIKCFFENNNFRYESEKIEGDISEVRSVVVRNQGEVMKLVYKEDSKGLILPPSGLIYSYDPNKIFFGSERIEALLSNMYCINNYPLDLFLQGKNNDLSSFRVVKITNEDVDNVPCKRIHIVDTNNRESYQDYWISIQQNYSIIKLEIGSEFFKGIYLLEYEVKEGIWFVKQIKHLSHEKNNNNYILTTTRTATFSDDWQLNIPIPLEAFHLDFPESVKIVDQR